MVPMHLAVFNVFIFMTVFPDRHVFLSCIAERNLCAFFQSCRGRLWRCWHGYWTWHLLILLPFSSNIVIWQKIWVPLVAVLGILNACICLQQPFYWHLWQCYTLNEKNSVSFCEVFNSFVISFQIIWKKKSTTKVLVSERMSFAGGDMIVALRKYIMIKEPMTLGKPGKRVGVQGRLKQDK